MTIQSQGKSYLPALTGVRVIASTLIFLVHFNPIPEKIFGHFIYDSVNEFHIGVTIFFVLSGFLICYRYAGEVAWNRTWFRKYFVIRFARIYPMYFLLTILSFLPLICHCLFNTKLFLLNISFLRGFFDEYKFTGVKTGWSLTVEECFYFLFPFIILTSARIRMGWQFLGFLLLGVGLVFIFRPMAWHGFFSSFQFLFEFTFFGRCIEFFTGMMLAFYIKGLSAPEGNAKYPVWTTAGLAWMVLCVLAMGYNRRHSTSHAEFIFFETLFNNFLLPVGIAAWFFGLIREKSWLRYLLGTPLFDLLGKSSYVFYLIHNGFVFALIYEPLHRKLYLVFIALELISVLLYLGLERPLNKFFRKWTVQ